MNISADNRLYSIAAAQQDNAPNSIRVAASLAFSDMAIQPGDLVQVIHKDLCIGNVTIDIAAIVPWQSVLPAFSYRHNLQRLEQHTNIVRQYIGRYGKGGGLRDLWFASDSDSVKGFFSSSLAERAHRLLAALRTKDMDEAYRTGRSLIGLGGGLTPSGDDFCAALLTVIHMPGSPFGEQYRQLGQRLANAAAQQTTAISQEMLITAACGQSRQNVIVLLQEITGPSPDALETASLKVLQMGSLSGTDWMVGLTAGLEVGKELAEFGE